MGAERGVEDGLPCSLSLLIAVVLVTLSDLVEEDELEKDKVGEERPEGDNARKNEVEEYMVGEDMFVDGLEMSSARSVVVCLG